MDRVGPTPCPPFHDPMNGERGVQHAREVAVEIQMARAPGEPTRVIREDARTTPVCELRQMPAIALPEFLSVAFDLLFGFPDAEVILSAGRKLPELQISGPNRILETFRSAHESRLCRTKGIQATGVWFLPSELSL